MQTTAILEHQMSLRIFDAQLGAQGIEDICELRHCWSLSCRNVGHFVYRLS
jgi:hypothetical protein